MLTMLEKIKTVINKPATETKPSFLEIARQNAVDHYLEEYRKAQEHYASVSANSNDADTVILAYEGLQASEKQYMYALKCYKQFNEVTA